MKGLIVILSGPSGVGKDTVLLKWIHMNPLVEKMVSYTTRPPRPGEVDGYDYRFVSHEEFEELARRGEFFESENVYGNYYASPSRQIERALIDGKIAVLKIDVKGARKAMKLRPDALTVFIVPPSFEELERRVRERSTESEPEIRRRLAVARDELRASIDYEYRVVNDSVDNAVRQINEIVMARYQQEDRSARSREAK